MSDDEDSHTLIKRQKGSRALLNLLCCTNSKHSPDQALMTLDTSQLLVEPYDIFVEKLTVKKVPLKIFASNKAKKRNLDLQKLLGNAQSVSITLSSVPTVGSTPNLSSDNLDNEKEDSREEAKDGEIPSSEGNVTAVFSIMQSPSQTESSPERANSETTTGDGDEDDQSGNHSTIFQKQKLSRYSSSSQKLPYDGSKPDVLRNKDGPKKSSLMTRIFGISKTKTQKDPTQDKEKSPQATSYLMESATTLTKEQQSKMSSNALRKDNSSKSNISLKGSIMNFIKGKRDVSQSKPSAARKVLQYELSPEELKIEIDRGRSKPDLVLDPLMYSVTQPNIKDSKHTKDQNKDQIKPKESPSSLQKSADNKKASTKQRKKHQKTLVDEKIKRKHASKSKLSVKASTSAIIGGYNLNCADSKMLIRNKKHKKAVKSNLQQADVKKTIDAGSEKTAASKQEGQWPEDPKKAESKKKLIDYDMSTKKLKKDKVLSRSSMSLDSITSPRKEKEIKDFKYAIKQDRSKPSKHFLNVEDTKLLPHADRRGSNKESPTLRSSICSFQRNPLRRSNSKLSIGDEDENVIPIFSPKGVPVTPQQKQNDHNFMQKYYNQAHTINKDAFHTMKSNVPASETAALAQSDVKKAKKDDVKELSVNSLTTSTIDNTDKRSHIVLNKKEWHPSNIIRPPLVIDTINKMELKKSLINRDIEADDRIKASMQQETEKKSFLNITPLPFPPLVLPPRESYRNAILRSQFKLAPSRTPEIYTTTVNEPSKMNIDDGSADLSPRPGKSKDTANFSPSLIAGSGSRAFRRQSALSDESEEVEYRSVTAMDPLPGSKAHLPDAAKEQSAKGPSVTGRQASATPAASHSTRFNDNVQMRSPDNLGSYTTAQDDREVRLTKEMLSLMNTLKTARPCRQSNCVSNRFRRILISQDGREGDDAGPQTVPHIEIFIDAEALESMAVCGCDQGPQKDKQNEKDGKRVEYKPETETSSATSHEANIGVASQKSLEKPFSAIPPSEAVLTQQPSSVDKAVQPPEPPQTDGVSQTVVRKNDKETQPNKLLYGDQTSQVTIPKRDQSVQPQTPSTLHQKSQTDSDQPQESADRTETGYGITRTGPITYSPTAQQSLNPITLLGKSVAGNQKHRQEAESMYYNMLNQNLGFPSQYTVAEALSPPYISQQNSAYAQGNSASFYRQNNVTQATCNPCDCGCTRGFMPASPGHIVYCKCTSKDQRTIETTTENVDYSTRDAWQQSQKNHHQTVNSSQSIRPNLPISEFTPNQHMMSEVSRMPVKPSAQSNNFNQATPEIDIRNKPSRQNTALEKAPRVERILNQQTFSIQNEYDGITTLEIQESPLAYHIQNIKQPMTTTVETETDYPRYRPSSPTKKKRSRGTEVSRSQHNKLNVQPTTVGYHCEPSRASTGNHWAQVNLPPAHPNHLRVDSRYGGNYNIHQQYRAEKPVTENLPIRILQPNGASQSNYLVTLNTTSVTSNCLNSARNNDGYERHRETQPLGPAQNLQLLRVEEHRRTGQLFRQPVQKDKPFGNGNDVLDVDYRDEQVLIRDYEGTQHQSSLSRDLEAADNCLCQSKNLKWRIIINQAKRTEDGYEDRPVPDNSIQNR